MDKVASKHEIRAAGVPTPDWAAFNATAFRALGAADTLDEIEARLGFPLVVKPASQGSSLGVEFASSRDEVPEALVAAFSYDDRVLLERYVKGRELAVSVLGADPLPIVEAIPGGGLLQLRGPLRNRPHRVRLPGRPPPGQARTVRSSRGGPTRRSAAAGSRGST